jgi:TorA maturation chaperone TorD
MSALYPPVLSEEQLRAGTYALLGGLLAAPLEATLLQRLNAIEAEQSKDNPNDLARAWIEMKRATEQVQLDAVRDEFQELFIGLGRGELVPYGSWYLSGFLMDKPVGDLRRDLAALGYERQDQCREPEDHVAALCEVMAMLILDEAISFERQREFFITHVGSWMDMFFRDLEAAKSAHFYRVVGRLGYEFMQLEKRYLAMSV